MLRVEPIALDKRAEKSILRTMTRKDYRVVKDELLTGRASLYQVGGVTIVLRPEGSELVVVSMAGSGLLPAAVAIADFGRRQGFNTARFHTKREDMGRLRGLVPFISTQRVSRREFIHRVRLL